MRKMILLTYIPIAFSSGLPGSNALDGDQVVPNFNKESKERHIPEDQVLSNIKSSNMRTALRDMGIKDEELTKNILKSQQYFQNLKNGNIQPPKLADKIKLIESSVKKLPTEAKKPMSVVKRSNKKPKTPQIKSSIQVYISNEIEAFETITLPSASLAPGKLMAGIEVSTEKREIDMEIDYAFLGPNGSVVEMTGCHTWLQVWGNYNTERIYGETRSISCRAPNGRTFEIPVRAQLRDFDDEYIGIKAELLTRGKIKAAAFEFLQKGTNMFGKAIAAAQVSTEVVSGGDSSAAQKGQNITGDQSKYILGQSIAGATGGFLQWWVDYYKNLSPTLATPPEKKVILSIIGEVQIPKDFFFGENSENPEFRLNTNKSLSVREETNE